MKLRFHVAVLVGWVTAPLAWGGPPFFYKVCGPFPDFRDLVGPKFHTDATTVELVIKKTPALSGRTETEFRDSIAKNGLYSSSPFIDEDLSAGSKLGTICTVFATGGVSFVVKEAITESKKLLNTQDRKDTIARAVKEAEKECDSYLDNLVEGK
jgi:hypothetical protein